jgi:xylan 1,4-beta-xylosidase
VKHLPTITNPILPGFNPDPSIVRVGDDYYLATSTFEWFPGVQIHHSKDLLHGRVVAHPLNRLSQLDLRGAPSSGGVWAPCLTYCDGLFYLIYTDVKARGEVKDTHNYLVTAPDILGEWSDPVYLNSTGFDPSLFHDDDGRKWLVNMVWDHRQGRNPFAGIALQEYSPAERRLVGPEYNIFKGTELGRTEGPHLYKVNGYYYLLTAEGGTSLHHSVTLARSRSLFGPYQVHPRNPVLTSWDDPTLPLQKAGHGDLVETQRGDWYMVHLCGRPIPTRGRCPLGRETAIQKVVWSADGWLELADGGHHPALEVAGPELPEQPWPQEPVRDDFDAPVLSPHFQILRIPFTEDHFSLRERPGYLRIKGRESLSSKHSQSLVARRQQAFRYTAAAGVEFEPETFKQMAGLICFYDTQNWFYLRISHDENLGKCLGILSCDNNRFDQPAADVSLAGWERCHLRARVDYDKLQFYYSPDGEAWTAIGPELDASRLADEYCLEGTFTGAMVGLCCQDLTGRRKAADFDYFEYLERS